MGNEAWTAAKLSMAEFAELVEKHLQAIESCDPAINLDEFPIISKYLKTLKTRVGDLKGALKLLSQSATSEEILQADRLRDKALSVFRRKMQMFELSTDPEEMTAYKALNDMWMEKYEPLAYMNLTVETKGIDDLVFDLTTSRFAAQVATLQLGQEVDEIVATNEAFKKIYTPNQESGEGKMSHDVREIHLNLLENYKRYEGFLKESFEAHHEKTVKKLIDLLPA